MRIGILGAAWIAPRALIDPAKEIALVDVAAVAASDEARAKSFAATHGIPTAYGNYEELISDQSLDAIYNALINNLHETWTIAALEAGHHVLCEKPFGSNAAQAWNMVAAAERANLVLMEAFHWRFHPVARRLLELTKMIGELRQATARFDANINPEGNRYQLDLAGGALMDLGCYAVHWLRTVAGEEPVVLWARATEGPPGIDVKMEAELEFPSGFTARMRTSMDDTEATHRKSVNLHIVGSEGWIDVVNPMAPQFGNRVRARLADGTEVDESLNGGTSYRYQLESFTQVVAGEIAPLTGGADSIGNMMTIDAIYAAAGLPLRN
jgi:predicted dehydrogenase